MNKKAIFFVIVSILISTNLISKEITRYYGTQLCADPGYKCIKVKRGDTWEKLFPDPLQRDIVQRINRTDMGLWHSKEIAVPKNLDEITIFDVAPFPKKIEPEPQKVIIVDQENLAWGAYDKNGDLVHWGPISSGKDYCPDIKRACITMTGIFYIFNKKDRRCESNIFPVGEGGANMPYCMFFYKGYALHGSEEVRGFRDSHGCVRLFTKDAKWLNEKFVELSNKENDYKGTKVIVQKLINDQPKE